VSLFRHQGNIKSIMANHSVDGIYSDAWGIVEQKQRWINPNSTYKDLLSIYDAKVKLDAKESVIKELEGICQTFQINLSKARILDVGCGFGTFVLACIQKGYDAYGIDISKAEIQFAFSRLCTMASGIIRPEHRFVHADARAISGELVNQFDVVTSYQVIEHVSDYKHHIDICVEYLKPGGIFIIQCPNYLWRWREPHYNVPWIPLLPKILARPYLRFCGMNTEYLDEQLFFVKKPLIVSYVKKKGLNVLPSFSYKIEKVDEIHSHLKRQIVFLLKKKGFHQMILSIEMLNPFVPSLSIIAQKRK